MRFGVVTPPIPHQQVENNTLLFLSPIQCAGRPEAARCPFARTRRNTRRFHFLIRIRPGDGFGRPHPAWQQQTFHSPSSEPLRRRPASLRAVVFVTTGLCSHFVTVILSLSILSPRLILLCADRQPPGPNCGNMCLIYTV